MGACFIAKEIPQCDVAELRRRFAAIQDQAAYEDGACYSGELNQARGLQITDRTFPDAQSAIDFLETTAVKRGPAIAVKVATRKLDGREARKLEKLEASYAESDKDAAAAWNLVPNYIRELVAKAKDAKSSHRGCKKCGSRISLAHIKHSSCPVCGDEAFLITPTAQRQIDSLKKKQNQLIVRRDRIIQEKRALFTVKPGTPVTTFTWHVGAICAS